MGRDTFDAVLAARPQSATAGRVTSKGAHWTPDVDRGPKLHWSAPPPMQAFRAVHEGKRDLTGLQVGRLTVIGVLADSVPGRSRWVVRCRCGDFEVRRHKTLRKTALRGSRLGPDGQTNDRCDNCAALQAIHFKYQRDGARPISDFFTSVLK